jgi:four helix bundle protein
MTYDYNLEERTLKFSREVINFCKNFKTNEISSPIINQLIRSATSVGANYAEANGASSRSDFRNKIHICKKEAQETKYWLRLLADISDEQQKIILRKLWQEAQEFTLIFSKAIKTLKLKN